MDSCDGGDYNLFASMLGGDELLGYASLMSVFSCLVMMIRLVVILPSQAPLQYWSGACSRRRGKTIKRRRRSFQSIREEYGNDFRTAYRMDCQAFGKLLEILRDKLKKKTRRGPNGPLPDELRLSAALRYFAGGSYLDIVLSHGISRSTLFECVWDVVEAVNMSQELNFCFPSDYNVQREVASEFAKKSKVGFSNCVGCIDGVLIWTDKPSDRQCKISKVDSGKYYCGRKGKYGFNMQAVCDSKRRFLDISIRHPASASDYSAFTSSALYHKLKTPGFLAPDLCLYGDNAYGNSDFMAVPFANTANGVKDSYNYFHSQVRMNIECSFGMLTNRWRILKSPLAASISQAKIIALTTCLCKLHNFCIDNGSATVPGRYVHDDMTLMDFQDEREDENDTRPVGLLGGGEHFDDVQGGRRGIRVETSPATSVLPRERMLRHVLRLDARRPPPLSRAERTRRSEARR